MLARRSIRCAARHRQADSARRCSDNLSGPNGPQFIAVSGSGGPRLRRIAPIAGRDGAGRAGESRGVYDAEVRGDGPGEIRDLAYDSRRASRGTLFFCVPGFSRDGHDFAPGRSRWARRRSWSSARSTWACPRSRSTTRGRDGAHRRGLQRRPDRGARRRRHHGDERQDDHRLPGPPRCSRRRATLRAARHGTAVVGGEVEDVERTTPEAIDLQRTFAECSTRATRTARWRSPRTRSPCTAPTRSTGTSRCSPTSPRTTSTSTRHGGLLRRQAPLCSARRRHEPEGGIR